MVITVDTVDHISYLQRKQPTRTLRTSDDKWIQKRGIEYSTTEPLISELFDDGHFPQSIHTTDNDTPMNVVRSYIYVISKQVDGRTFIKIGMSNFGNTRQKIGTRLETAQTFLIPGLENAGFRLHNLFFYRREAKYTETAIAELVERGLHSKLSHTFGHAVIHMPSLKTSEWYLPNVGEYKSFFDMIYININVQIPQPEDAYSFYVDKKDKRVRESKDKFMPAITNADIVEHRKENLQQKKDEGARARNNENKKTLKRGNIQYFIDKLLHFAKGVPPPLGSGSGSGSNLNLKIVDIYYHNKKSTSLMKFREYYAEIVGSGVGRDIVVDFTTITGKGTKKEKRKYYTHIRNVLHYMKHVSKTMDHEAYKILNNNYYHYFNEPIIKSKALLERITGEKREFKMREYKWLLGRILRDKLDNLYQVVELSKDSKDSTLIQHVVCREINKDNMESMESMEFASDEKVNVDPQVAIQLIVDYSDDVAHTDIDYSIHDVLKYDANQVRAGDDAEYDVLDFVLFDSRYFLQGGRKLPQKFVGVVTQKKWNFAKNKDTNKMVSEYQYDILFENGETWEFGVGEVHENSSLLKDKIKDAAKLKTKIKRFVNNVKNNKNVINKLCEKHGIQCGDTIAGNAVLHTDGGVRSVPPAARTRRQLPQRKTRKTRKTRK